MLFSLADKNQLSGKMHALHAKGLRINPWHFYQGCGDAAITQNYSRHHEFSYINKGCNPNPIYLARSNPN